MRFWKAHRDSVISLAVAILGPSALTGVLVAVSPANIHDYVFLYLGIVAVLGTVNGLPAALLAATTSFLLVDYYSVRPVHTLEFADRTDLVNLCIFFGAAGVVGTLGSRRRAAQLRAEALAHELQAANIELARLAETERQVRALEETDRLRREVLANVSHELRTPLSTILTGATTMQHRESLPDDMRADVDTMADEARRLNRLVSDILDISRIDGGIVQLAMIETDLREAIDAAIERLHRQNPQRTVDVSLPLDMPEVMADWDRLGQVLDNLLDNANRAGPSTTPIAIVASPSNDGGIVVTVSDEGPGIPEEMRDHVFERFVRGSTDVDNEASGMGLGLPIVRGLIKAHGGRVWIEDTVVGARVGFSLSGADSTGVRS